MLETLYKKNNDGRFRKLFFIVIVIFSGLLLRLVYLQIIEGDFYASRAEGNRLRILPITAARGNILDRNGQVLAGSRPAYTVSIMPTEKMISQDELQALAEILHMSPQSIEKKINDRKGGYEPIRLATDVGMDVVTTIAEKKQYFPGINIEVEPIRYYPNNDMLAQVLGYVGEISDAELKAAKKKNPDTTLYQGSITGRTGIERIYDSYLRGQDGGIRVEVDASGRPVAELGRKATVPGEDIHLTIDGELQKVAEQAVRNQLAYLHYLKIPATGAAVIAMDPNTGAILAMVSYPEFDPNSFAKGISSREWKALNSNPAHPFENKVISGQYPPGSPFKVITAAAALELKKITTDEKINDTGKHWLIDKVNAQGEAFGWINIYEAMAKSDNVFFYELGRRVGIDALAEYARKFGLGKKTGIRLDGELSGNVASAEYKKEIFNQDWYLGETFDAAIGQSYSLVTPIQMAVFFSQIANGGIQYVPYLVSRIDNKDGTPAETFSPKQKGTLEISKNVMDIIRTSLRDVAQEGGTAGELFKDYPVKVAGKTGTSENSMGTDHGWFAAYAPYDKPRIVVVALVQEGSFGSLSAAPIVKAILDAYFHIDEKNKMNADESAAKNGQQSNGSKEKHSSMPTNPLLVGPPVE